MRDPAYDIDVLNDLIEITVDSYEGYREAADRSKNTEIADLFSQRAFDRRRVLCGLRHAVQDLGGRPVLEGTIIGSARRVIMDLRAQLSTNTHAFIEEMERSEDHLEHQYEQALNDYKVSAPIRDIIEQAYLSVKTCHDTVSELKQACS